MSETGIKKGRIIRGIGGFYYIRDGFGVLYECKARGRFRKDGVVPLTGDWVVFSENRLIEQIEPRRNVLIRPKVANVDLAAIVVSAAAPKIDNLLCDKLLISVGMAGIEAVLVINKCDIADKRKIDLICAEYARVCRVFCISSVSGDGIEEMKAYMTDRCTCLAGQSAVGKTSLVNAMFPGFDLETDGLSRKTERGKHTTRQAELLEPDGFSGTVVDTPGFSFFDAADVPLENLWKFCPDMAPFGCTCRFATCLHAGEPDCGIKQAVESGWIHQSRYQRYLEILKELQEKREKRYD